MNYGKIKEIDLQDNTYWDNTIFLTFDIDWCCDVVLEETINLVEKSNVEATWFVTHDTPILDRLRANLKFELGVHPNFNNLLNGDFSNGRNATEVLDRILNIVPEAKSVRCHSMTQSTNLLQLFKSKGLTHECNHFIPEQINIPLKPWELWNGLIKVPYFWEDDIAVIYSKVTSVKELMRREGLKVFDFHPIHVFLNTENLNRYESIREIYRVPEELIKQRYQGIATRNNLEAILGIQ